MRKKPIQGIDASETSNSSAAESNVIQLATMLFDHIEEQINLADTKAQLTLAADTLLAATITLLSKGVVIKLWDNSVPVRERLAAFVSLLLFVSLITSVYFALLAARPTLRLPKQRRSLFYFGHIAQLSEQEFTTEFLGQSATEIQESILAQAYAKAVIANYKYARVRRSINFLVLALILWALLQVVIAFQP